MGCLRLSRTEVAMVLGGNGSGEALKTTATTVTLQPLPAVPAVVVCWPTPNRNPSEHVPNQRKDLIGTTMEWMIVLQQ